MEKLAPKTAPRYILFLDGECVFCQSSALFLHRIDLYDRLYFAPLQGETAQQLPDEWRRLIDDQGRSSGAAVLTENLGTQDARFWRGADAPLRSLKVIGAPWSVFWLLSFFPKTLKDWVYAIIARNRHHLLGKNQSCKLPNEAFKARMLP